MASYFSHTSSRETTNHLEWKQTGTVGGWIWDQRKTHLHLSNICRGYLEKLDAFELRSGFWMILGISPYQEAKKHQGFMMSWWFRVLSFTVGTRSNKSARDITIITQPNRSEENTVILQIDRRNFQLLIPPVKFENVHFQMFRFRFFRFFYDICWKKYSFTTITPFHSNPTSFFHTGQLPPQLQTAINLSFPPRAPQFSVLPAALAPIPGVGSKWFNSWPLKKITELVGGSPIPTFKKGHVLNSPIPQKNQHNRNKNLPSKKHLEPGFVSPRRWALNYIDRWVVWSETFPVGNYCKVNSKRLFTKNSGV